MAIKLAHLILGGGGGGGHAFADITHPELHTGCKLELG